MTRQRVLIAKERMSVDELRKLVAARMEGFELRQAERERRRKREKRRASAAAVQTVMFAE